MPQFICSIPTLKATVIGGDKYSEQFDVEILFFGADIMQVSVIDTRGIKREVLKDFLIPTEPIIIDIALELFPEYKINEETDTRPSK